jgi:hypothetical protein
VDVSLSSVIAKMKEMLKEERDLVDKLQLDRDRNPHYKQIIWKMKPIKNDMHFSYFFTVYYLHIHSSLM